ncbi:MAG: sugar phosphate isomerase/epimerase [Acidobacteria bacterium]|nr:sugar phosphate isomerase/epimerase [Acidobacteriota bacterium]
MNRRQFLAQAAPAALGPLTAVRAAAQAAKAAGPGPKFRISLAQWSVHKAIRSRLMTNLDFPRIAREQFGIEGLEFVNTLWESPTAGYVQRLKVNMNATGTKAVLIMCDDEGYMGAVDKAERLRAADNHRKWVDITAEIGGHAIRTNMYPGRAEPRTPAEVDAFLGRCEESFHRLCEYAKGAAVNVIIENHGGISSDADVVVRLMNQVNRPNFGTLPDFGNFPPGVDKYEAVRKLMAFAKGVSLKCFQFGPDGNDTTIDLARMMKIVLDHGYRGYVGIEFEGEKSSEFEGIQSAKRFLDRLL